MADFNLNDLARMMASPELIVDGPTTSSQPTLTTQEHQNAEQDLPATSHANEWAVSYEDFPEFQNPDVDDVPVKLYRYQDEQRSILERLTEEVTHSIKFGNDIFEKLNIDFYSWGVERGTPSHQENPSAIDLDCLKPVYIDYVVRVMVEHEMRMIRLPVGPTAVKHLRELRRLNKLGTTYRTPLNETQLDSLVLLSDGSTASDPLKVFSVYTVGSNIFISDLAKFRESYIDTSEALQAQLDDKLSVHFSKPNYSIVVGTTSKEVKLGGNYMTSFLISIPRSFADAHLELVRLDGVRTVAPLTACEKSELSKVFHDVDNLCRVEFDSFISYDSALYTHAVQYGWKKFPMISSSEQPVKFQQLCLHLKWFTWPSKRCALISLDQTEVERCTYVLERHDFLVYDKTDYRSLDSKEGTLVVKARESEKFYKMWHYESELKRVMQTIFDDHKISYRKITLMRKRQQDIESNLENILAEVNLRIIRSAYNCDGTVWSRTIVPGTRELDVMAADQSQLPWETTLLNCIGPEATIEVRFHDEVFGRAIVDYMMPRSPDSGFFKLFSHDSIGVRILPFYRVALPVPRNIVRACIPDLITTTLYYGDAEPDTHSIGVNKYGTRNSFGRILAQPSNDEITVELWPERIIPGALAVLSTVLEGQSVDCSREPYYSLLYGRGLEWLNNMATHSEPHVVMRVDRLQFRLVLYGSTSSVTTFLKNIHCFCTERNEYVIKDTISIERPRFLTCMPRILGQVFGRKKLSAQFGEIKLDESTLSIRFRGALEKLVELQNFLDNLNEKILVNAEPSLLGEWMSVQPFPEYQCNRPICPVCASRVQLSAFCLDNCGHYYCLECLCEQIDRQTRSREFPWRCLYPNCEKEILLSDIKELICLGGNVPFWYIQDDIRKFFDPIRDCLIRDPTSGYIGCDTPNCLGLFKKIPGFGNVREEDTIENRPSAGCTDCGVTRCLNCLHFAHDGLTCWRNARVQADVDASIAHFKERNANARNCPTVGCGAVILKADGCNHVFCPYCKTDFCWTCFRAFDSPQAVYGHMHSVHGGFGGGWAIENNVVVAAPNEEND